MSACAKAEVLNHLPDAEFEHQPLVLVVEDDPVMRGLIVDILENTDARVVPLGSSAEAMDFIENQEVAVVVTDLRMPRIDGMAVLQFARKCNSLTQIIMVTGHATVESAVESLKAGAFEYVCKPFENIALRHTVELALSVWKLSHENLRLRERNEAYQDGDVMIGCSEPMKAVERLINAASGYDCSVLISGHSGCGKELVAHKIHLRSSRRNARFVALNCAAIPEQIIESELFGYQKGAFTGADKAKPGLFESADGGTLFLDEINNAPLSLQAKLLRVLQDSTFYRLGDTEPRRVDVRFIAASNRDIPELISDGLFREDLYYRLRVIEISLPPLSSRRSDIPLLANYFIQKFTKRFNKPIKGMSTQVLGALMRYRWPGNVRELENAIQRAIILTPNTLIDVDSLAPEILGGPEVSRRALDQIQPQTLEEMEIYFIRKTLRETDGDRTLCAEILGIDKSTLWRKMKRYNIQETG